MTSRTQLAGRGSVLARRNLQSEIGTLKSPRTLSYVEAVREATDLEMARDPAVILFGLDVDDPKAIQGTARGLVEKYGPAVVNISVIADARRVSAGDDDNGFDLGDLPPQLRPFFRNLPQLPASHELS